MLIDIDSKTKEEVQAHLKNVICKPEYVSHTLACMAGGQICSVVILIL
jgi:ribosomal protein S19